MSDIESYLIERNRNPKPYQWKAKGVDILRKIPDLDGRREGNLTLSDSTLGRSFRRSLIISRGEAFGKRHCLP